MTDVPGPASLTPEEQEALRRNLRESMGVIALHFHLVPRWKGERIVWSARRAYDVHVTGDVQGACFTAWTRDHAKEIGVLGWVRNGPNGSVEAHFEGAETAIRDLIARVCIGPPGALVDDVEVSEGEVEDVNGFEIHHVDAGYNVIGMKAEDAPDISTV